MNFNKSIDNLGRIVIPMDIRKKLNINSGDILSFSLDNNCISLSKCNYLENNKVEDILKLFEEHFNIKYILTNHEKVIFSNVINKYSLLNEFMINNVKLGNKINGKILKVNFGNKEVEGIYNMVPIITNDGIVGSLIILDNNYNVCLLISKIISLYFNIS